MKLQSAVLYDGEVCLGGGTISTFGDKDANGLKRTAP
ncbi:aminomethyltransferase beta-barrel domain-containing protein [Serpentinimonas maccroryi]